MEPTHTRASAPPAVPGQRSVLDRDLAQLLEVRDVLAEVAGAYESHWVPNWTTIERQQHAVETMIRDRWPAEHANRSDGWLRSDYKLRHPAGLLSADCAICQAICRWTGKTMPEDC